MARGSFEAVGELAQRYSIEVVGSLAGLPDEGREHYMRWADCGFNITGPDNALARDGFEGFYEMFRYCFEFLTSDRLAAGGWSSAFHRAGSAGELEPEACAGLVMAIVWAGMDTTVNAITAALHLFGRHPDQWQRLRADRSLMSSGPDVHCRRSIMAAEQRSPRPRAPPCRDPSLTRTPAPAGCCSPLRRASVGA